MADVFVSYQKRDRSLAQQVVHALAQAGYSVWWDDRITPAESWDRTIEREIQRARCVLVLWTKNSVESEWVRIEATFAKTARPAKLVQARFEPCEIPIAFSLTQYADVFDRRFDSADANWSKLLEWVSLFAGPGGGGAVSGASVVTAGPAPAAMPAHVAVESKATAPLQWWPYLAAVPFALIVGGMLAFASNAWGDLSGADRFGISTAASLLNVAAIVALLALSRRLSWVRAGALAVAAYAATWVLSAIAPFIHSYFLHSLGRPTHQVSAIVGVLYAIVSLAVWTLGAALLGAFKRTRGTLAVAVLCAVGAATLVWTVVASFMANGAFDRAVALMSISFFLGATFKLLLFPPPMRSR